MAASRSYYQQEEPRLGNQYLEDTVLRNILQRRVPPSVLSEDDLIRFGARVSPGGDILALGRRCEDNPPYLKSHNAFGRRTDEIVVDMAWQRLKEIAAEEGIVAIGYERKAGKYSRLHQLLKVYLWGPSSAVHDCPLSMADGGARLIEERLRRAFTHLVTRDPCSSWSSGQWMTEKTGGSDIRGSETVAEARPDPLFSWALHGYKYFTSATTSEMAFTLARTAPQNALSCFYVETRTPVRACLLLFAPDDQSGELNQIVLHRLKDKFGTRPVPTAELEMRGTPAILVGGEGDGIRVISSILNITRIHNACASVSGSRRALALARDYAARRRVLGQLLSDNALHVATLAALEIEVRACQHLLLDVLLRFGRDEAGEGDDLLRLLTPLLKLYAGKMSIAVCSEAIECLGGTGYMEDSHVPVLLRDAQVTAIWEGTTNVLSHDLWRPILKQNALRSFALHVRDLLASPLPALAPTIALVHTALESLLSFAMRASKDAHVRECNARAFALSLARTYMAALLVEHAGAIQAESDVFAAQRFVEAGLNMLRECADQFRLERVLAMDVDAHGTMRGTGDGADGRPRARY